ncbi:MAG: permease prefix domain 1-containing protein, partial [Dermatophilaceae bacterium]
MPAATGAAKMGVVSSHLHAAYLARLDAALVGPRRVRRSLLAEAEGHLEDATDALTEAGLSPDAAARRAVTEFGDVGVVAPAFQETLTVASSRRTAWLLLLALSYQPFLWD